ncbi:tuberoinfundibular peptide of 39 residues [Genypterus blacodes]|uniref:tuberoinfundibular peptide of 39 residues n=1 Tax=Genypterus blacodes TaxID=154954 RepID=UPI003F76E314
MPSPPSFPCTSLVLLCILGMGPVTTGFPQPGLRWRHKPSRYQPRGEDWDVRFPFISLRDWSVQMMSASGLRDADGDSKNSVMREEWPFGPERMEASVEGAWPAEWRPNRAGVMKRNMVMADDAAFREKSKLLTSMERQKWLNSYMQKLLVVNSS